MKRVIEKANEIHESFGNDPENVAEELGLYVIYQPLTSDLKEIYFSSSDSIVIDENLPDEEKRELIAHAICHHLMHAGNHVLKMKRIYSYGNYQEKQANVFAACLLIPRKRLYRFILSKAPIDEIANWFEVSEKLVKLRLLVWLNFEKNQKIEKKRQHFLSNGLAKIHEDHGAISNILLIKQETNK